MGDCHGVPVLGHPCQTLVHHIQGAVALFVTHLAHLEQYILAAGGHRCRLCARSAASGNVSTLAKNSSHQLRRCQPPAPATCNKYALFFHGSTLNSVFTFAIHCNNNNTGSAQCHRTQRAIANKGQFFAIFTRLLKNAPRC